MFWKLHGSWLPATEKGMGLGNEWVLEQQIRDQQLASLLPWIECPKIPRKSFSGFDISKCSLLLQVLA